VRGRAPPKPGCKVVLLDSRVQSGRASKGARTQLAERLRNRLRRCSRATTALRGRIDFEWLFQACSQRAARRGGSAPAARSSKVRSRRRHGESVRALFVRGGRGPGGSQPRSASRSTRTEAGDGENPRPLSVSLLRERRAHEPKRRVPGRSRDAEPTRRCTSASLRLRRNTRGRRPRRDGPRSHLFGSA